jgi:hypothetical protein
MTLKEPAAVERVGMANPNPGPLFETDGTRAAAKSPASQSAASEPSTLMRVLRYFRPRELSAFPSEGS